MHYKHMTADRELKGKEEHAGVGWQHYSSIAQQYYDQQQYSGIAVASQQHYTFEHGIMAALRYRADLRRPRRWLQEGG